MSQHLGFKKLAVDFFDVFRKKYPPKKLKFPTPMLSFWGKGGGGGVNVPKIPRFGNLLAGFPDWNLAGGGEKEIAW